jgi:RHS repeat-associated protein
MIHTVNLGGGGWANYNYEAGKERTRKVISNEGGVKQWERLYLGGMEVYRRYGPGGIVDEIETHHLYVGEQRMLLVEDVLPPDRAGLGVGARFRYQFGNHLGSACVELDENAAVITYEEYHPYGTSAYRAERSAMEVSLKRYRYTGKERDEETGLSYHSARYYAPWLGRWASCDSAGMADGPNIYQFVSSNPIIHSDPTGKQSRNDYSRNRSEGTSGLSTQDVLALATGNAEYFRIQAVATFRAQDESAASQAAAERYSRENPSVSQEEHPAPLHESRPLLDTAAEQARNRNDFDTVRFSFLGIAGYTHFVARQFTSDPELLRGWLQFGGFVGNVATFAGNVGAARLATQNMPSSVQPQQSTPNPPTTSQSGSTPLPRMSPRAIIQMYSFDANANLEVTIQQTGMPRSSFPLLAMNKGNAMEREVQNMISSNPVASEMFLHLGGANRPDWIPNSPQGNQYDFINRPNYDLFSLNQRQLDDHLNRPYGPTMIPIFYLNPEGRSSNWLTTWHF